MPLSAKLVVVGGEVKTAEIKLRLPSTIGRGRGTTIMLPHPLVSRTHCELYESDGRLMVRDLGSLNGTFINNQRVTEAPLPAGELLTVGTVTFRAVYETDDETSGPPSGPGPVLRTRGQDTDPNGTIRANSPASSSSKTPAAPMDAEFNFGQPLVNFDDDDDTGPPAKPPQASKETARSEATVEELDAIEMVEEPEAMLPQAAPTVPAPPMPTKGKPTPAKPPAPAAAAPAKAAPAAKPAALPPKPAAAAPQPAPAPKPAAPKPATPASAPGAAQKEAPTVVESKWKESDDEAVQAAADDDDDFNDFLKSLDTK